MAKNTAVMFNDGLRYIDQAQRLDKGALDQGLKQAVDHPAYPTGIMLAHRILLAAETPDGWQTAAQFASVFAGVLWVIPLYLVSLQLFGGASAWLSVLLALLVPITGHTMADVLSESTFLLFFTWGLYTALKFLSEGTFLWLPPTIAFAGLAYLTRPEGLLLPLAMIGTLGLMPFLRSTRLVWPRWWAAVGFLVIGPALIVGPYIAMKGGLGTKPAVQRLLGTAPKSAPNAVERQRPLDPNQSTTMTYLLAVREMAKSVQDGVTLPLLPFVAIGLFIACPPDDRARTRLFVTIVLSASMLALVRLHATGGYCTPRHALIITYMLIPAAGFGLYGLVDRLRVPGRWLGLEDVPFSPGPGVWAILLGGLLIYQGKTTFAPINEPFEGYRNAGQWVAEHVPESEKVADLTGLSLFYGGRSGYTFANIIDAPNDANLRYVVVRDAHLHGPWPYCEQVRAIVGELKPVATYPAHPKKRQAQVYVFERPLGVARNPSTVTR
jgi:hypothetical protein